MSVTMLLRIYENAWRVQCQFYINLKNLGYYNKIKEFKIVRRNNDVNTVLNTKGFFP